MQYAAYSLTPLIRDKTDLARGMMLQRDADESLLYRVQTGRALVAGHAVTISVSSIVNE